MIPIKTKNIMSFLHHISLPDPDPLGGGLREEIAYEESEGQAQGFADDIDGDKLTEEWAEIMEDLHKDPEWFEDQSIDE
jgi:hypothetical protein